jgi:hypothetical protein
LTLASVLTLQIDEDGFYFYTQDESCVCIFDQPIYDEETEAFGNICRLEWQIERGEPSQKRRK